MRFVVSDVALGEAFLRALRVSFVSVIPPTMHTHLHLHVALTRRTNWCSLGTLHKELPFWEPRSTEYKITFKFFNAK